MQIPLEQHVQELRDLAKTLTPYSFPKVKVEDDQEVIVLRSRQLIVDGFDVAVTFCISDHDKYLMETLQIHGVHTPFLPFALVCKIAKYFLGSENLSFTDVVRENRKFYCWSLRKRKNGKVLPAKKANASDSYEGFTYSVLKLGNTN